MCLCKCVSLDGNWLSVRKYSQELASAGDLIAFKNPTADLNVSKITQNSN
jgi:hypothetical protein